MNGFASSVGLADYARACVEALVAGESPPPPPTEATFAERAACFVSIKKGGTLRGCVGTLAAAEPHLGAEIARNARSAALEDPRFPPITPRELPGLSYSVDVLGVPEDATMGELDERRYGVIVSRGSRRGVLLPDLRSVDSVSKQVAIALQKAGIAASEPYQIRRFSVRRHCEQRHAPAG